MILNLKKKMQNALQQQQQKKKQFLIGHLQMQFIANDNWRAILLVVVALN